MHRNKLIFSKPLILLFLSFLFVFMLFYSNRDYAEGKDNDIVVINYNVSGHLRDYSHEQSAYIKAFNSIKKNSLHIDFVSAVEMLDSVNPAFLGGLNAATKSTFKWIGRKRGGIPTDSPDEITGIYYNSNRWKLKEYNSLDQNPVLANGCANYTLEIKGVEGSSAAPCELAKKLGGQYTFPINFVQNKADLNYFPGDKTIDKYGVEHGPWNRIATFGVFTSLQDPNLTLIIVATHFPKGKGSEVAYKEEAFKHVYENVIQILAAGDPNAHVIFMGDLNYKPDRDKASFDLLAHILHKGLYPLLSQGSASGENNEVLWTIASANLIKTAYKTYFSDKTANTTDHIVTKTTFQ